MALANLNLVLVNLNVARTARQVRDAVAGTLGRGMPSVLSQGRPLSPRFATFDPTLAEPPYACPGYERSAKRVGRSAASRPGHPVRPCGWRELAPRATSRPAGSTGRTTVGGRGLSTWCERHQSPSGHDYPSHDRRDDRQTTRTGSASITNRGK